MLHGRFHCKGVLVTGAASGIGRATALRLAGEGARMALADRDGAGLADVASAIGDISGEKPECLVYDAGKSGEAAAMTQRASERLDGLDVVICNAGIYRRARFSDISGEDWALMLSVNLASVADIIRVALPSLTEKKGNVVTVASTAALQGIAYAAHYAAAKSGVVALSKSLAVEYAPSGVRFNVVCPGKVQTAIGAGLAPLEAEDASLLVRPPRLAGYAAGAEPEDIAAAIAFLASDDARFVSGSVLVADGAQNIG